MVPREQLKPLTSLRFFAALLVFVAHDVPTRRLGTALQLGGVGVGFFYLLSGFILIYTYHRQFAQALSWRAARDFYAARIARIYPVHVACTVLMLAVLATVGGAYWTEIGPGARITAVLAQLGLIESWFPDPAVHLGVNLPAWSISVEAFFYLLFPVLAYALLRGTAGRREPVVFAFAVAIWLALGAAALAVRLDDPFWAFYFFPPARLADFAVGILLGIAFLRRCGEVRFPLRPTSVEILAVGAIAFSLIVSVVAPKALRYAFVPMPACALLITLFARERGHLSRALCSPIMVRLGEISFAFYLVHFPVLRVVDATLGWSHAVLSSLLAFTLSLAASLALFHFVEQPLRVRVRRALASGSVRRTTPVLTAASAP